MKSKILVELLLVLFLTACSAKKSEEASVMDYSAVKADTALISSSAAVVDKKDKDHQFIRTAELKFKVKSVLKSTYDIENLAKKSGGYVTFTNLTSSIENTEVTEISADSSLEIIHYIVSNNLIIKVPTINLDTTLRLISKNIEFLDYRIIKADDVALEMLSNTLSINRGSKYSTRITGAIDNKAKKLNETTNAEDLLFQLAEKSDRAYIANRILAEQVSFSTITINIYQSQTTKYEKVANEKNIRSYEPGFGSKLIDSLQFGWMLLEKLILILANLWVFFVIGGTIILGIKFYQLKSKK